MSVGIAHKNAVGIDFQGKLTKIKSMKKFLLLTMISFNSFAQKAPVHDQSESLISALRWSKLSQLDQLPQTTIDRLSRVYDPVNPLDFLNRMLMTAKILHEAGERVEWQPQQWCQFFTALSQTPFYQNSLEWALHEQANALFVEKMFYKYKDAQEATCGNGVLIKMQMESLDSQTPKVSLYIKENFTFQFSKEISAKLEGITSSNPRGKKITLNVNSDLLNAQTLFQRFHDNRNKTLLDNVRSDRNQYPATRSKSESAYIAHHQDYIQARSDYLNSIENPNSTPQDKDLAFQKYNKLRSQNQLHNGAIVAHHRDEFPQLKNLDIQMILSVPDQGRITIKNGTLDAEIQGTMAAFYETSSGEKSALYMVDIYVSVFFNDIDFQRSIGGNFSVSSLPQDEFDPRPFMQKNLWPMPEFYEKLFNGMFGEKKNKHLLRPKTKNLRP